MWLSPRSLANPFFLQTRSHTLAGDLKPSPVFNKPNPGRLKGGVKIVYNILLLLYTEAKGLDLLITGPRVKSACKCR